MLTSLALALLLSAAPDDAFSPPPLVTAEPAPAPQGPPPPAWSEGTVAAPAPPPPMPPGAAPSSTPAAPAQSAAAPLSPSMPAVEAPARPAPSPNAAPPPRASPAEVESAAPAPASSAPTFELRALVTGSPVTTSTGTSYAFGARGEIDLFRVAVLVSWDRSITSSFTLSDTQQVTALAGYSVLAHKYARIRVLGGVDVHAADTLTVAPAIGVSARAGLSFLAADVAATFTPLPFRRIDARAGLVLKGGLFELQGGYRAQVIDTTSGGTLATLFATPLAAGPYLAVGVSL